MSISTPKDRLQKKLADRWMDEDFPGGPKHFQPNLFVKDLAIFLGLPLIAVVLFKSCEFSVKSGPSDSSTSSNLLVIRNGLNQPKSQILDFHQPPDGIQFIQTIARRAPGTLVRVRLQNQLEAASVTPVHALILDDALGKQFKGSILLGDANSDGNMGRVRIDFKFVKLASRSDVAVPLSARALSLDGTFGIAGEKKEGFFARAAMRTTQNGNTVDTDPQDFKSVIARALAAGLVQEFQTEASQAYAQSQVLTVQPQTEFYVELTDYFPGGMK
jgi:hypothetical protein